MDKEKFIERLVQLRMNKNVSARDMSLSIGQSINYINQIENGKNLPSMMAFFYICKYLEVSPQEFFDIENTVPERMRELIKIAKGLDAETMGYVVEILKRIKK